MSSVFDGSPGVPNEHFDGGSVGLDAPELVTVIEPRTGWVPLNFVEIWRYRDLLGLLVWRDVTARYRQSVLGIAWAVFRPLAMALIYTLVFSVFVKVETTVPYPIFAFSALIPWLYFSTSMTAITSSVSGSGALLTKVYFPRLVLPLAAIGVGIVEVIIQFVVLAGMMVFFQFVPSWRVAVIPVLVGVTSLTAFGFGVWLTALNVRYRDVGLSVPFLLQAWMYLCPVVYPVTVVPEAYRGAYFLNPMVGVIEGFRWSLFDSAAPNWQSMGLSACGLVVILVSGLFYFRRNRIYFRGYCLTAAATRQSGRLGRGNSDRDARGA